MLAFKRTYNEQWMLEKYDYRSPAQVRRDLVGLDAAALEANTVKPLSKNPVAVHVLVPGQRGERIRLAQLSDPTKHRTGRAHACSTELRDHEQPCPIQR